MSSIFNYELLRTNLFFKCFILKFKSLKQIKNEMSMSTIITMYMSLVRTFFPRAILGYDIYIYIYQLYVCGREL
jgi:hypothetical protein